VFVKVRSEAEMFVSWNCKTLESVEALRASATGVSGQ